MEGENAHANRRIWKIGAEPRYPTPCMLLKANTGVPEFGICSRRGLRPPLPDTHTPTHAREKSLNFFAFRQQQMGNWPINCCDALGLPISARNF